MNPKIQKIETIPETRSELTSLAEGALAGAPGAREALRAELKLDDLNLTYFLSLYRSSKSLKTRTLRLAESGQNHDDDFSEIAYSTAVAPASLLSELPMVRYDQIPNEVLEHSRNTWLWLKKMHAGTGTSVERRDYLAEERGIDRTRVQLGAKGTDLFVSFRGERVSLAEAQLLRAIDSLEKEEFAGIIFQNVINEETRASLRALWNAPCPLAIGQTYAQYVEKLGSKLWPDTVQQTIPTLDENSNLSQRRRAPGGHALFALDALLAGLDPARRPAGQVVCALSNGEDLSASPDGRIVGWMVANQVPIVMVTTQKTSLDKKGGQIALVDRAGEPYVTIVESAQAKAAGQETLFEKLGLEIRENGQTASFNTNMALFNYEVLAPILTRWTDEIGEAKLLEIACPDLIRNPKKQKDTDGVERRYIQLEGALGSTLLKLDRFYRESFGKPLVHFVDIPSKQRTSFFSPIKTAFDFILQFHSDRFTMVGTRLRDLRPGGLLATSFDEPSGYYDDVRCMKAAFAQTSLIGADALRVKGRWRFGAVILEGTVEVCNDSADVVDLAPLLRESRAACAWRDGVPVLRNVRLDYSADGKWALRGL